MVNFIKALKNLPLRLRNPIARFRLYLSALIFWAIFIFIMSSFSAPSSSSQSSFFVRPLQTIVPSANPYTLTVIIRKTAHFIEYAILGLLAVVTFYAYVNSKKSQNQPSKSFKSRSPGFSPCLRPIILLILACAMYSITDEFHQSFVPGRSPQPTDIMIDTIGVITGIIMFFIFTKPHKSCYNKKHGRN